MSDIEDFISMEDVLGRPEKGEVSVVIYNRKESITIKPVKITYTHGPGITEVAILGYVVTNPAKAKESLPTTLPIIEDVQDTAAREDTTIME